MRAPRFLAVLLALATVLWALVADAAYQPPPLTGHVVDEAGALTDQQKLRLDRKLDRARRETGFAVVVFLLPRLPEGMSIEDVGYETGNAWKVGSKKGDDGVILLASLEERKLRIETGKGVGGALTDVQSSHINREVIGPLMKEGRVYEAMDRGAEAILRELVSGTPGGVSDPGREPGAKRGAQPHKTGVADIVKLGVIGAILLLVIVGAIVSPTFREILFWVLLFGVFRGGGGRGGGGGGDGGSGYGGGGGSFGGGGSSDDY
jgi:uncharacterized protein